MGLGPITALYHARFNRYLHEPPARRHVGQPRCGLPRRRRVRRARDARRDLARLPRAARQPVFVVNCNLQRLDGPVRGNGKIIQELEADVPRRRLERDQGHLGLEVGRAARQGQGRRAAQPDEHHRRRRVPALRHRERRVHPRPLLRPRSSGCARWCRTCSDDDLRQPAPRRPRLPQAVRGVQGGHREPRLGRPDGDPRARRSRAGRSGRASRAATRRTRSRR